MAPGETGHRLFKEAQDAYNALPNNPKASGVVLHRKDHMVVDGKFKWVPVVWKIDGTALTLTPAGGMEQEAEAIHISSGTQYKKPKSKHYPLQFGSSTVYTTAILQTVVYQATGYANSPLDPLTKPGTTAVEGACKIAALEESDLEKLLYCIQAVIEGKHATAYIS